MIANSYLFEWFLLFPHIILVSPVLKVNSKPVLADLVFQKSFPPDVFFLYKAEFYHTGSNSVAGVLRGGN